MRLRNSTNSYGMLALSFHWATVVLVAAAWLLGQFGDDFPKGAARASALFVHISAGLAILTLLAARCLWRLSDPPPPPEPTPFGRLGKMAAGLGHLVLYGLLAAVPIAGIAAQFARGNPLPVFGLFEIASPWTADRTFARSVKEVHEWLSNALVILALLHAAAALVHHWVLRDRTLRRMVPLIGSGAPT